MTSKANCNENFRKSISGIFGKKFMGTHCNALLMTEKINKNNLKESQKHQLKLE